MAKHTQTWNEFVQLVTNSRDSFFVGLFATQKPS
jgi:hypothetical protein